MDMRYEHGDGGTHGGTRDGTRDGTERRRRDKQDEERGWTEIAYPNDGENAY